MKQGKPNNAVRKILTALGVVLYHAGLAAVVIRLSPRRVRALLYHAVEDSPCAYTKGLGVSVTSSQFAANLDYFKRYYNVVSVNDLNSEPLPRRTLVITFDDGYASVFHNAAPALHARNLPACVYLISRAVRGELVWVNLLNYAIRMHPKSAFQALAAFPDLAQLQNARQIIVRVQQYFSPAEITAVYKALHSVIPIPEDLKLYANATEILAMQRRGMQFGFHTRDHFNLRNCNDGELLQQLDASELKELTNTNSFAYPFGYFNAEAVKQTSRRGYSCIMTVGNNNDRFSQQHLDRTEVFTANSAMLFAQLEVVEPVVAWLRKRLLGRRPTRSAGSSVSPASSVTKTPAK